MQILAKFKVTWDTHTHTQTHTHTHTLTHTLSHTLTHTYTHTHTHTLTHTFTHTHTHLFLLCNFSTIIMSYHEIIHVEHNPDNSGKQDWFS